MKRAWPSLFPVAAAVLVAGCGSSSSEKSTSTGKTSSTKTKTSTTAKKGGGKRANPDSCKAKGINNKEGKEGTCIKNGEEFTLVNKNSTLRLGDLRITLRNLSTEAKIGKLHPAKEEFVVAELKVINRGKHSVRFDEKQNQVRVRAGGKGGQEAPMAEALTTDSFFNQNKKIKPDTSQTGTVVFRVSKDTAKLLTLRGADGQIVFFEKPPAKQQKKTKKKKNGTSSRGSGGPDGGIRLWQ
jgi:Domain of unknown function (DUF4352)